jgi:hypothetical protein
LQHANVVVPVAGLDSRLFGVVIVEEIVGGSHWRNSPNGRLPPDLIGPISA